MKALKIIANIVLGLAFVMSLVVVGGDVEYGTIEHLGLIRFIGGVVMVGSFYTLGKLNKWFEEDPNEIV